MARRSIEAPERDQASAVLGVVEQVLGNAVRAVYLYGSAVTGGLRTGSDLDLFAIVSRPTTDVERGRLVEHLLPISRRGLRKAGWRPVELTVVVESDIKPWRYPPRTDFQFGEWLRERFDAGHVDPEDENNPDLAVLVEMVRRTGQPILGPSADQLLPDVPRDDLAAALVDVVPGLLADLDTDTANVLLTLARIWHTLETWEFASKDSAADWAIKLVDHNVSRPLAKARDIYVLGDADSWAGDLAAARVTAAELEARIGQRAKP